MSEDMGDKIKQIADMLGGQNSNANIPDNFKGLLNMFMSGNGSKEEDSSQEQESDDNTSRASKSQTSDSGENTSSSSSSGKSGSNDTPPDDMADMARKLKKAASAFNTNNDPKVNLLNALRPYLNNSRQKKLQTCMKIIKMGSLSKLFDESE